MAPIEAYLVHEPELETIERNLHSIILHIDDLKRETHDTRHRAINAYAGYVSAIQDAITRIKSRNGYGRVLDSYIVANAPEQTQELAGFEF